MEVQEDSSPQDEKEKDERMSVPTTITVDGVTLTLTVERKRVRNINARLRGTQLFVSAPLHAAQKHLDTAIPDLARRLIRRVRAHEVNAQDDALALAREVATRFPTPPQVEQVQFVTTQESRWGSYSAVTRTIRLNAVLRAMPTWVLKAVVAHELAHVFHLNHSSEFKQLLRRVYPDTDRADMFLSGVSWMAQQWECLPPVERALLTRAASYGEETPAAEDGDG